MLFSWLTPRLRIGLIGLLLTLGAIFCGWQYMGRTQAEQRAQAADSRATAATAQAAVLADTLAKQNAAVSQLQKKLSLKQQEVSRAQRTAAAIKKDAEKQVAVVYAQKPAASCEEAWDDMRRFLEERQ